MFEFAAPPPLALYVHYPWCVRKCPYCDFNSHTAGPGSDDDGYLAALIADLEQELPLVWGRTVTSVFLGGGTPGLLSPERVERLLAGLRARVPLAPAAEITLEANPGAVEQARFREFRAAGINRLSLGVQSFAPDLLRRLGRIHGPREALAAAEAVAAAGFESWNLDLMYGLPGQTAAQALADIEQALALAPPHLSHYQLTLEPDTAFHRRPPSGIPDDADLAAMEERCRARLERAGYRHYEVSAHSRPGEECRHNLNYWRFGDYLGIGAGAHGKITDANGQRITRRWKIRTPRDYIGAAERLAGASELTPAEAAFEFMLNALRLKDGFPVGLFAERCGLPETQIAAPLARAEHLGLIARDAVRIRPTERGWRYLDDLIMLFLADRPPRAAAGAAADLRE